MVLSRPVFIHGWAFSSRVFRNFRGIKIDLSSHGGKLHEPYVSFEREVERIALSLPGKHDIVGWSLGGSLAILLALKFPRKVNRLILIGTTLFFKRAWSEKNVRAFKVRVKREGVGFFRKMILEDFDDPVDLKGSFKMLEDYIDLDLRALAPFVNREIIIVHGADDNIVPVNEAIKLYNMTKRSKLIILKGNHLPVRNEESLISALLKIS